MATAYDFGPRQYKNRVPGFEDVERVRQTGIYDLADVLIHVPEPKGDETDSVTTDPIYGDNYHMTMETWGRESWYIEHHFAEGDSAVVDQVGGVFDNNGKQTLVSGYDVAGVEGATGGSTLIRKYSVTTGNPDFANARGVGLEDSEWMPIPSNMHNWRDVFHTIGNHGPYVLDENTLESEIVEVDFTNKVLTVPWGIRRLDDIMQHMEKKPGIAWHYDLNELREDSLYRSARSGDKLTIYVLGSEMQVATFDIVVNEPTPDRNIVVPIHHQSLSEGPIIGFAQGGILGWPRVTKHDHGTDTITGTWHGLSNALRTDSLLKYLEKPNNATWEFLWVDGIERPNLKNGDKLKITAQDGSVKEYFIQVQPYTPSHNANLSSITWPDIPEKFRGIFGWLGDTIPNFSPLVYNYKINVPFEVDGIPALVANPQALNATVDVNRATSLEGSKEERTISFIVKAEDDSVTNTYNIELIKEKDPSKIQPYEAEPFLSELVYYDQWANCFGEIVNPGNQPLDLSNYMMVMVFNSDVNTAVASRMNAEDWLDRYDKYVPGYKWANEAQWAVTPGILERDLQVNSMLMPGDVFTFGAITNDGSTKPSWIPGFEWWVPEQLDVQFLNTDQLESYRNPWDENVVGNPIRKNAASNWYLFKILNDSIKLGLKPANDIKDFELIENFGMIDGSQWIIGGVPAVGPANWMRKPHVYEGNKEFEGSFGTNADDSEWTMTNRAYWQERNVGWPLEILNVAIDLGQHFVNEPTHYKSTVTSSVYKVSDGFTMQEEIWGIASGTTVETFLSNLNKADENQSLTVKTNASELTGGDLLSPDDVLEVLSADSTNTTNYILQVSDEGLSSNAVLTSGLYDIVIESEPKGATEVIEDGGGYITGFEYGTELRTVLNNVMVPEGASLSVIDGNGAYVPLTRLNFDTSYVNVTVHSNIYFDVTAENGVTRILYQLQPNSTENDAFILSDVYDVIQSENLVNYVPRGTNIITFLSNVVPSLGASVMVVDKMGFERTEGTLYEDDKVVVASSNNSTIRVYHLSLLRTQYILETTYLAYVLSDLYAVDQVEYIITGPSGSTNLADFYANIMPSMGATAIVVDASGNEKTTGDLEDGDRLKVTSVDGKIVVMYDLMLNLTSVDLNEIQQIEIYPNPTNGKLNVRGVDLGNRIQIFNASGAMVRDMKARSSLEVLSLDDQPTGMFLIVISNDSKLLGRYKAIKK